MSDKSLLLQFTGDSPIFKIVDFLLENKGFDFSKKDIIEGAEISRAALFKCWSEMESYGLVKVTRKFGKTVLYTLNAENPLVKRLVDLELELIRQSMIVAKKKKEERVVAC
ncbi:hypothetical protein HY489_06030 [Candidatus Woesearchaeota archaeon]|nr:hypothetical protein [Candidatus Woesearchaeota archaeon]